MFEQNMSNGFDFDSSVMGNNNVVENDMNVDINMIGNNMMEENMGGCQFPMMNSPISEGVQEKCIHKTIVHEVPQVCPFM